MEKTEKLKEEETFLLDGGSPLMFDPLINLIAQAAFINSIAAWLDLLYWPVSSSGAAAPAPAPSLTPSVITCLPTRKPFDVRLTAAARKGHRQISMIKVGVERGDLSRSQ